VTSNVFAEILCRLDLVVFERLPDGVFLRLGPAPAPEWFVRLFRDAPPDKPITVAEVFPFLESFLTDAEAAWKEGTRLRSDPFTVTGSSGGEADVVAYAVAVEHRRFLIIELPPDAEQRRRTLQSARDGALAHEDHVRRTGALSAPLAAAQQLARQLATAGLNSEQQRLAAAIDEHLSAVAASIETLAPKPKGVSRRSRR
jgi:hypothetical protein